MKLVRFFHDGRSRAGLLREDDAVVDFTNAGVRELTPILESPDPAAEVDRLVRLSPNVLPLASVRLLAPVEQQEVWAAGVTYLRSKKARMEESDFSASAYDKVYEAPRPEIFFKSMAGKVRASGETVGIRGDAKWNVPEPELALFFNSNGVLVGFTAGNDMSSRDIEGENLLYLPQAKIYKHSCALGPCVVIGRTEAQARQWAISVLISRGGQDVFKGETRVDQIKREFKELAAYLFQSQEFPTGVVLLTGTGVVPPNEFTLRVGDVVRIEISGIGVLENTVEVV